MTTPAAVPILTFTGAGPRMPGFPFLWLKYVRGFDRREHCAKCLVGAFSTAFKKAKGATATKPWGGDMHTNTPIVLDEVDAPLIYLCGVSSGYKHANNLHVAFRPQHASVIEGRTWNGYKYVIENAEQLEIPGLPAGFLGLPASYTTCRNFQFGWTAFGDGALPLDQLALKERR
jgi:hypothetical protein